MFLISNHILICNPDIKLPKDTVVRINCAWVENTQELKNFIDKCEYPIFLDYPSNRIKPPQPTISIETAIGIANRYAKIEYFSYSNASDIHEALEIWHEVDKKIVPKIEDIKGVVSLRGLVEALKTDMIMIDKEDLFTNCNNIELYLFALDNIRDTCKELNIKALELYGVIFSHD